MSLPPLHPANTYICVIISKFVRFNSIMKKIILALFCGAALLFESCSGCKENNVPIDYNNKIVGDTTYVLPTPPTALPHNVLVEEFTGQSCSNCPAAHEALQAEVTKSGNHVNVIGYYIYGPPQSNPPGGAVYDFRDSLATDVNRVIFNSKIDLPSAGVDRTPVSGEQSLLQAKWAGVISSQLAIPSDMNMEIETSHNAADTSDTVVIRVIYTKAVTGAQYLSAVVVEDSMIDIQEKGITHEEHYLFTNVFRGMLTPVPAGSRLGYATTIPAGTVFQKTFVYRPKKVRPTEPVINTKNCRVIAFVHSADASVRNYQVYQSVQARLRP